MLRRTVQKFLRLSSGERRLLVAAALAVVCVRISLWLLPFKRVAWMVERTGRRPPARPAEDRTGSIARAVTTAARHVPHSTCLTQALAAQWLCAWFGRPTMLRIGVAKGNDKTFRAHAWLESDGRVIVGGESLAEEAYAALPLPAPETVRNGMPGQ